ncbi:hypothetical protein Dimus_037505, partial [Dionaea muscipula]
MGYPGPMDGRRSVGRFLAVDGSVLVGGRRALVPVISSSESSACGKDEDDGRGGSRVIYVRVCLVCVCPCMFVLSVVVVDRGGFRGWPEVVPVERDRLCVCVRGGGSGSVVLDEEDKGADVP